MKRRTVVFVAIAVSVAVAAGAWTVAKGRESVQYRTAAADRGDVNVVVSATGNPNAVVTVQVGTQVSGVVVALLADWNSKVRKGQLIARIDPAPFQAQVDQAQANLDAARATVANAQAVIQQAKMNIQAANSALAAAEANVAKGEAIVADDKVKVDRRVIMVQKGADAKEDLETAQTTYKSDMAALKALVAQQQSAQDGIKVAQAQLDVANSQLAANQAQVKQYTAALQSAQLNLTHTNITAPVDGVVVSRTVDVGQTVAASLAAPTLFQIAQDLTKMQVDTNVSEADVGHVRVGQPAAFSVDAYPGRTFAGTVTSIREAPINVQNVVTYDAVIGVSNADLKLFPGMTANVKIMVNQRANVLRIPNAGLRYRPAGAPATASTGKAPRKGASQERAVWVLDHDGKPKRVQLTTGETDGSFTEVLSGALKEGDRVITAVLTKTSKPPAASPGGMGRGPGF